MRALLLSLALFLLPSLALAAGDCPPAGSLVTYGLDICTVADEHGARVSKDVAALSEGLHHLLRHEDHSALGMRAIGRALWWRALNAGLLGDDEDFPHPDTLEAMGRGALS